MAAEKEELVAIIPKNEYKPELEIEVALHTARVNAMKPFKVDKKYKHIVIPEFKKNEWRERENWEMEEIRRCREGYDGMPGRYYYFFNHARIKHKKRRMIRPDFRATQMFWAMTKDRISKSPGKGLVMIKRRQVGMSWDMAADNIYDCQFNNEFDIGMNSKSEKDSYELFDKHKYIHRNQSPFLRGFVHIDKRDAMKFGKWMEKTKKWKGTQSSVISVAPTANGHASKQYIKLVIDEAGEHDVLPLWGNAEDCIMQDGIRVGIPYIFGTVGDAATVGQGIMEFWKNHKVYDFEQFAFWGYNCLIVDEFGNDDIEESIRWIIYTRHKKEKGSTHLLKKFIQKYPLNEEDAFLDASGSGVGDPLLLTKQKLWLFDNPPIRMVGYMRPSIGNMRPDFVPDEVNGKIIFYGQPDLSRKNGLIAALDPAEDDDVEKTRDTSNLSTAIIEKPFGLDPPKLLAEFCDRPKKLRDYYYQLALLLMYCGNLKVNIELNKGGWRALDWFELNYPHLVQFTPAPSNSVKGGIKWTKGVKMTTERKTQMKGLGDAYVENYNSYIPSVRLIDEFRVFGAEHKDDDFATAFLWALVILQGDKTPVGTNVGSQGTQPTASYENKNGRIQLVGPTGEPARQSIRPRSALFKGI